MSHAVWLTKVKEIFMLYKKMVRFFSSLLTVLVCCGIFASAAYPRESPRIGSTSAVLSKDRYDDLCISCTIRANGVMDTIGISSIRIERYNGSRWVSEDTLTDDDFPYFMTSNQRSYIIEQAYTPRYTDVLYRAVVNFYAEDSGGKSTESVTSNSI